MELATTVPPPRPDPLAQALEVVGDRWSLAVVDAVLRGRHRFGQLLDAIDGLAPNILSRRLRHLEAAGLVVARAYQHRPPRFAYEPTDRARALAPVIAELRAWAGGDPESGDDEVAWV